MKPSIYIAGSSRELARARAAMRAAEAAGWSIAYDWVTPIERAGRANDLDRDVSIAASRECMDGILRADRLWVLLSDDHSSPGAHVELGFWFGLGWSTLRTPILSGGRPGASIFYSRCAHVESDAEALELLASAALSQARAESAWGRR